MAPQNSRAAFGVRADSGTIYVKEPLDYEQRQQYTLVLDVTDGQHTCILVFWNISKELLKRAELPPTSLSTLPT